MKFLSLGDLFFPGASEDSVTFLIGFAFVSDRLQILLLILNEFNFHTPEKVLCRGVSRTFLNICDETFSENK